MRPWDRLLPAAARRWDGNDHYRRGPACEAALAHFFLRFALCPDPVPQNGARCMSPLTQAAVVHYALKPDGVELREIAVPPIGEDDVLLEVGAVSVCASDVHQARNTQSWPGNVPV